MFFSGIHGSSSKHTTTHHHYPTALFTKYHPSPSSPPARLLQDAFEPEQLTSSSQLPAYSANVTVIEVGLT